MLSKHHWYIVSFNLLYMFGFLMYYLATKNYEFIVYIGVLLVIAAAIMASSKHIKYSNFSLWLLTIWGLMHVCGGSLQVNGDTLYRLMILHIVGDPFWIFKYDQLTHLFGFFTTTFVLYEVLKPSLTKKRKWISLGVILIAASMGMGALNEVIEFATTLFDPNNGVGGYENTAIDLVCNMIGAIVAFIVIRYKENG